MKKNSMVKIAFVTCEPMMTSNDRLYLCLIYDVNRDGRDYKNYIEEQLLSNGYILAEFWELPPIPYSTACALARDNEIYSRGQTMVDPEVYFKYGPMSLRTFSQPA